MQSVSYYLEQSEKVERLSGLITDKLAKDGLTKMAQDYGDIAEDLQSGAIEIRDREQMPQLVHQR